MGRSSKLLFASGLIACVCWVGVISAQSTARQVPATQVAELQFDLARALAMAGEHDAAAREFERALQVQRAGESATPEQLQAVVQTVRAYHQSRPDLPRMRELGRQLTIVERRLPANDTSGAGPAAVMGGRAIVAAPTSAAPLGTPQLRRGGRSLQAASEQPWWMQINVATEDLMIPADWEAALRMADRHQPWPRIAMTWPELLIPEGWDQPSIGRFAAMLLVDPELLVPPGW